MFADLIVALTGTAHTRATKGIGVHVADMKEAVAGDVGRGAKRQIKDGPFAALFHAAPPKDLLRNNIEENTTSLPPEVEGDGALSDAEPDAASDSEKDRLPSDGRRDARAYPDQADQTSLTDELAPQDPRPAGNDDMPVKSVDLNSVSGGPLSPNSTEVHRETGLARRSLTRGSVNTKDGHMHIGTPLETDTIPAPFPGEPPIIRTSLQGSERIFQQGPIGIEVLNNEKNVTASQRRVAQGDTNSRQEIDVFRGPSESRLAKASPTVGLPTSLGTQSERIAPPVMTHTNAPRELPPDNIGMDAGPKQPAPGITSRLVLEVPNAARPEDLNLAPPPRRSPEVIPSPQKTSTPVEQTAATDSGTYPSLRETTDRPQHQPATTSSQHQPLMPPRPVPDVSRAAVKHDTPEHPLVSTATQSRPETKPMSLPRNDVSKPGRIEATNDLITARKPIAGPMDNTAAVPPGDKIIRSQGPEVTVRMADRPENNQSLPRQAGQTGGSVTFPPPGPNKGSPAPTLLDPPIRAKPRQPEQGAALSPDTTADRWMRTARREDQDIRPARPHAQPAARLENQFDMARGVNPARQDKAARPIAAPQEPPEPQKSQPQSSTGQTGSTDDQPVASTTQPPIGAKAIRSTRSETAKPVMEYPRNRIAPDTPPAPSGRDLPRAPYQVAVPPEARLAGADTFAIGAEAQVSPSTKRDVLRRDAAEPKSIEKSTAEQVVLTTRQSPKSHDTAEKMGRAAAAVSDQVDMIMPPAREADPRQEPALAKLPETQRTLQRSTGPVRETAEGPVPGTVVETASFAETDTLRSDPARSDDARRDPIRDLTAGTSVQGARSAVGAQTDSAARVSEQIAQASRGLSSGPVEITLSPEELGRVRLHLTTGDAGLNLIVTAERPETLDLLRRNIDQLAQDYRELGFSSLAFSFGGEGASQQGGSAQPYRTDFATTDPTDGTSTAAALSGPDTGMDIRI